MDFPSNSNKPVTGKSDPKQPAEKKEVTKVVSGEVVSRKKPLGSRMRGIFVGGEFRGATMYITSEVLLPALRNMIVDATSKGIERFVYGESQARRRVDPNRPRVSYNTTMDRQRMRDRSMGMLPDQPPLGPRRRQTVNEIVLVSRDEAELVLERLVDIIEKYDVASVADLNDLVGLPTTYVDNNWGWTNLSRVAVRQIREGFLLDLPQAEPI